MVIKKNTKINFPKGKKGWIKIIEAFISILFLIGVVAIVIQSDNFYSKEEPILEKKQIEILNGIQLDKTLRAEVLATTDYTINSTDPGFSSKLKNYLDNNPISNTGCFLKVCLVDSSCTTNVVKDEMYTKSVLITSTLSEYNPKRIQIFCYKV